MTRTAPHASGATTRESARPWQVLSLGLAVFITCKKSGLVNFFSTEAGIADIDINLYAPIGRILKSDSSLSSLRSERLLSQTSSSSACEFENKLTCEGEHERHPHDAMFYLFNAILIGTAVLHLTTLPHFHSLQQTVVMFVLGVLYSFFQQFVKNSGIVCSSYTMWMAIDPHLLLFALLPALLTGDAMTVDTLVARAVAKQCVYLASVGVLVTSFLTAIALRFILPYETFTLKLCLVTGSILAATDPVAVVGLLKNLGASPTLTVQIQGESLLNDGTAIVLYTIAYRMLNGELFDTGDIIIFLVKTALCAAGLGTVLGWCFVYWIKLSSKRLQHHACLIQISLTLCCAYWSFIIAEGALHISGVLCTVMASLVLADQMWPTIVDKESMHHVWHMFEYLGNTVIFFLAGSLSGQVMLVIPGKDYIYLIIIYAVSTVIRFTFLMCSRPILQYLSEDQEPVGRAEATIMAWGGLRGAVGLALAIQVKLDRADCTLDELTGERVLFYVAGIAALTLTINATTCPALVRWLRITSTPDAKKRMLFHIYDQLQRLSRERHHPDFVQNAIRDVLKEAKAHVEDLVAPTAQVTGPEDSNNLAVIVSRRVSGRLSEMNKHFVETLNWQGQEIHVAQGSYLVATLEKDKRAFERRVKKIDFELLDMPALPWAAQEEELKDLVRTGGEEISMVTTMNEGFLSLVRNEYWEQIEAGEFLSGSSDAQVLLNSVALSFKHTHELGDFKHLRHMLNLNEPLSKARETVPNAAEVKRSEYGGGDADNQPDSSFTPSMVVPTASEARSSAASGAGPNGWMPGMGPTASSPSNCGWVSASANPNACDRSSGQGVAMNQQISMNSPDASWNGNGNKVAVKLPKTRLQKLQDWFENSFAFNITIVTLIGANSIFIAVEQAERNASNEDDLVWFALEITFSVIFCIECVVKIIVFRLRYFLSCWNIFDFVLVIIGIAGLVIEAIVSGDTGSEEARLLRLNRVFRVLRIVRVFRLAKFIKLVRAYITKGDHDQAGERLAESLKAITILRAFVKAHAVAQAELLNFVGRNGELQQVEEARTIIESQIQVYRAIMLANDEAQKCDVQTLQSLSRIRRAIRATLELSKFVVNATKAGIINGREAESILGPMQARIAKYNAGQDKLLTRGSTVKLSATLGADFVRSHSGERMASVTEGQR